MNVQKLLCLAVVCGAALALAEDPTPTAGQKSAGTSEMSMFHPHPVLHAAEDKKELDAMVKAHMDAMKSGDMTAMEQTVDFPVLMVTDNAKGEGMAMMADRDQWTKMMSTGQGMDKSMKMSMGKPHYELLSDSLALITHDMSGTQGKKKMSWKTMALAMKKNGKWMIKSMVESGWGDMPMTGAAGQTSTGGSGSSGQ